MNDEGSWRQYPLLDGPYDELTEWEASTQETKIFYYKDMYEMEMNLASAWTAGEWRKYANVASGETWRKD